MSEGRHHPWLLHILAKELGVRPEDIVDFDLNVIDTQAGVIGGASGGSGMWVCSCWLWSWDLAALWEAQLEKGVSG